MPDARPGGPSVVALLAGGRSTRMGRPKELMRLRDGRTMAERLAEELATFGAPLVLVGDSPALPDLPRVRDLVAGAGPLGGIAALLASGLGRDYLVCPCDLPRVEAALLAELPEPGAGGASLFRVAGEPRFRPLPARLDAGLAAAAARRAVGASRSLHGLLEAAPRREVPLTAARAAQLDDADTPEEFARLRG